jgi:hypothetical protein
MKIGKRKLFRFPFLRKEKGILDSEKKSRRGKAHNKKDIETIELEKIEIQRRLNEDKLQTEIAQEVTEDLIFQRLYEKETGEQTKVGGNYTKEYLDWRRNISKEDSIVEILSEENGDVEDLGFTGDGKVSLKTGTLKDLIQGEINDLISRKNLRFLKKETEDLRIVKIARDVAEKFSYERIIAADLTIGGNDVHGYLQMNYEDYEELLANYVLDRAAYFAQKEHKPDPVNIIRNINLKDYVKTAVEFYHPVTLRNFPEQTFTKAIFYARENLSKAVKWIDGIPWEIEGYPTNVNLGKCNIILLDFPLWNVPAFLVLHAPGKDYGVFDATIDQDDLKEQMIEVRKQIIHDLRTVKKPLLEQIDQYKREGEQWRESYTHLKDKAEVERGYNIEEMVSNMEGKKYKRRRMSMWDYILIAILLVFIIILAIWFFQFNAPNTGMFNSTISSSSINLNNLFKMRWL